MKVICGYALGIYPESRLSQRAVFAAYSGRDLMWTELLNEIQRYIAEPLLFLELATVHVALCPYPCRAEFPVLGRTVEVGTEGGDPPVSIDIIAQLNVGIKVQILGVVFLFKHYSWRVDVRCRFVF